jgi:hypothetical protein
MPACAPAAALRIAAVLALGAACGCKVGAFTCADDSQCDDGGAAGMCEATGGCSFPDPTCASGRRYGNHAPDGLGGTCVVDDLLTTQTSDPSASDSLGETTEPDETLSATDPSADADSTTAAVTASAGSDTSTTTAPTTTAATDMGSSESTGGPTGDFLDEFDRPDAAVLGNGWIEKTAGAFMVVDEHVELEMVDGQDFRNNLFYRPLSESLLEVEASVVVDFVADEPFGFPQLHLRVQADDVDVQGSLTSYAVFVDTDDPLVPRLTVNRIAGPGFGPAQSIAIEPPPVDAETYRLRGRVTGTDPVLVEGWFEVSTDAGWDVRAETSLLDTAADRIVEAGTLGAGGHVELHHFALDDFAYTDLSR